MRNVTHYRDSDKREVDFVIERDDGHCAGIEVKCGSVVGKEDFNHLKWFQAKFNMEQFVGIVPFVPMSLSSRNHVPFRYITTLSP